MEEIDGLDEESRKRLEKIQGLKFKSKIARIINASKTRERAKKTVDIEVPVLTKKEAKRLEMIGKVLSCKNRMNALLCIKYGAKSMTDIAIVLNISPSTLNNVSNRLEQYGVAEYDWDSRFKIPSLTEFGEDVVEIIEVLRKEANGKRESHPGKN